MDIESVGEHLRNKREKAGLNVSDVVHQTRIPNNVIVALEAGDFSIFDSPAYAKSFLSQYGVFLEVETGPWLNAIEAADHVPVSSVLQIVEPRKTDSTSLVKAVPSSHSMWSAFWVLLLSFAIVGSAFYGYFEMEKRFSTKREVPPSISAAKQEKITDEAEQIPMILPMDENQDDEQTLPPRAIIVRE